MESNSFMYQALFGILCHKSLLVLDSSRFTVTKLVGNVIFYLKMAALTIIWS